MVSRLKRRSVRNTRRYPYDLDEFLSNPRITNPDEIARAAVRILDAVRSDERCKSVARSGNFASFGGIANDLIYDKLKADPATMELPGGLRLELGSQLTGRVGSLMFQGGASPYIDTDFGWRALPAPTKPKKPAKKPRVMMVVTAGDKWREISSGRVATVRVANSRSVKYDFPLKHTGPGQVSGAIISRVDFEQAFLPVYDEPIAAQAYVERPHAPPSSEGMRDFLRSKNENKRATAVATVSEIRAMDRPWSNKERERRERLVRIAERAIDIYDLARSVVNDPNISDRAAEERVKGLWILQSDDEASTPFPSR